MPCNTISVRQSSSKPYVRFGGSILLTKTWSSGTVEDPALRGSEIIGSALGNKKILKSEARNPKSETISNDQNSNAPNKRHSRHSDVEFVFVIRAFNIGICFEFRYSDFEICRSHLPKSCPLGLGQSRVLWTRIFTRREGSPRKHTTQGRRLYVKRERYHHY